MTLLTGLLLYALGAWAVVQLGKLIDEVTR